MSLIFILGFLAGLLIIIAQATYINQIVKKEVTPSVLSWLGWSLLMGISFIVQLVHYGWNYSLTGLGLATIGCFSICLIAYFTKQYKLAKADWVYLVLGLICILFYVVSKNPLLTTIVAVLADFVLGIPTLISAYKNPESEKSKAWNIGLLSWSISLVICYGEPVIYWIFPVYLFLYNGVMSVLTFFRKDSE